MSIKLMSAAWDCDMSAVPKLILMAYCDMADDHGRCWPGRKRVADKCRVSVRTLDRHVSELIDSGYMIKTERRRDDGSQASNVYHVVPSSLIGGGDNLSPQGVTSVSPGRHQCLPLNHQKNHQKNHQVEHQENINISFQCLMVYQIKSGLILKYSGKRKNPP